MSYVDEVRMIEMQRQEGINGNPTFNVASEKNKVFGIKRFFYIYGSSSEVVRGKHANRRSKFILVNISGTSKVKIVGKDGYEKIYELDAPDKALYIPEMVWKEMYDFSDDSVLLVLSSERYDSEEYIRDFEEYIMSI